VSILRVSIVVTALALLSRVLGLGRDLAVTWAFGASTATDAFYIASSLSNAAYVVIATSLASATVPFLAARHEGAEGGTDFAAIGAVLNVAVLALAVLALIGWMLADPIALALASGGSGDLVTQTAWMVALLMPTVVLLGTAGVFSGILNHARVFVPVAAAPAVLNLAVILCVVFLWPTLGIVSAVVGTVAGSVLFLIMQVPVLYRIRYRHSWKLALPGRPVREFLGSAGPVIVVALLGYAHVFVDIGIAARLGEGTVTAVNVASKLIQLPQGVIAMGLTTAAFPVISRLVQDGRTDEASGLCMRLAVVVLLMAVPAAAFIHAEAALVVSAVFGRGTFTDAAVTETGRILALTVLALPAFSLNILLLRVFFALRLWRVAMGIFLAAFAAKLGLGVALAGPLGVDAIGVSTVVAVNLNALLVLWYLERRMPGLIGAGFGGHAVRILLASVMVYAAARFAGRTLDAQAVPEPAALGIVSVVAAATFGLAGAVMLRRGFGFLRSLRGASVRV